MAREQLIIYIVAGIVFVLTWTGLMEKTPRGKRMARLLTPIGFKLFYTGIMIIVVILVTVFY
jgi:hypothetical protein